MTFWPTTPPAPDAFMGLDPAAYNLKAWNHPWWQGTSSTIMATAGTVYVAKIYIPAGTVTSLHLFMSSTSPTLTADSNFAGLYSPAKARLGVTADQSTAWATGGRKDMALTASVVVSAGYHYVCWYANGSVLPTPQRGGSASTINGGLSAANSLWATADTGLTGTGMLLPSTLGTFTANTNSYVVGVS